MVCRALKRDSLFPTDWDVRPWLFIPESLVPVLLKKLSQLSGGANGPSFSPVITPLEMTQPWRYRSWNRVGEAAKPESVPPYLTI
jgi:hypothetical protein